MAGTLDNEEDDAITAINVTPFVDVMLVLLVIFMVTANYINNQSIQVKLPKASTGETAESVNLGFVLDKQSKLYLDGNAILFDDIKDIIAEKKSTNAQLQALISADIATPHGDVIKLIDIVRKNGITDFAINVEVGQED